MCKLDHVALCIKNYDWYLNFFETVFDMKVKKESGQKPARKLWFNQGIQLIECSQEEMSGTLYDHIALKVKDRSEIFARLKKSGCEEYLQKENWFLVGKKLVIEIL